MLRSTQFGHIELHVNVSLKLIFVVFPFLIISSPPLSVSASVRMDSPPGSHSRPRNHRHSHAVICAQTRCYSIDCPAWPIIFVCWFHLSAPTVVRYRRLFSPHYFTHSLLPCGSLLYFVFTVFSFLCTRPRRKLCRVGDTAKVFSLLFLYSQILILFPMIFPLFDFFDFSFSNVK